MPIEPRHVLEAERAKAFYIETLRPAEARADWLTAVRTARDLAADALRASAYLRDIEAALADSCGHSLIFRQMLSPPMSQDQFALVCPEWSKTAEKDNRPLVGAGIRATAAAINERMDHTIAPWLVAGRDPTREDVTLFLKVVSALLASQTVQTQRRTRLAAAQENAVIDRLQRAEWTRLPSRLIDHRAQVPARHFMYKTRFATSPTTHQEVDIACGLPGTYVVAMECKVTNDETNSVKRVNDVLKKATAWRRQWGAFVQTAALLQGVIAPKDVQRLTDAEVEVFWSHDLDTFMAWLAARA